jgi:uncharacterized protein
VQATQRLSAHDAGCPPVLIRLGAALLQADHEGALWFPEERALLVADLHLEKGSFYAARGQMLPPYDSAATLVRLARLVARHRPRVLVALGDSFHDARAGERMDASVRDSLIALGQGREIVWLLGNHDPELPVGLPGATMRELSLGGLALRHVPSLGAGAEGEVAGHLHPVAKVATDRGRVRRRCFITDGRRLVMPAFGAFAGGLNVRDAAISGLFSGRAMTAFVLGQTRVYPIGEARLAAD